jgi:hypothetical protein
VDILKEYTFDEKFKKHLRFFIGCRMADFYFPCHPERSEGSHFLMFFGKKEKEEILRRLQNDIMDNTIVILSTKTEGSLIKFCKFSTLRLKYRG